VCINRELKLRAFLMQQVNDHLSKQRQRALRPKHGSGLEHVSFDYSGAEDRLKDESPSAAPEAAFDYRWARNTLDRCLSILRNEEIKKGREASLPVLLPFLDSTAPGLADYAHAASTLSQSEETTRQQVSRLRQRYKAILTNEVAHTLAAETGVEPADAAVLEEMRCLATAIQKHG
jgi:RNA polymerase sigma-70 factor (ECF subfamily)